MFDPARSVRTARALLAAGLVLVAANGCTTPSSDQEDRKSSNSPSATASSRPTPHHPSTSSAPSPSTTAADPESPAVGDAMAALNALPVKGRAPKTGYARKQFGSAWEDTDRNGCDTRNDILRRELSNITLTPGTHECKVASGDLADPYTGAEIAFTAGRNTSSAVQIDHVVSLSNAWQTGAQQLSTSDRVRLANDPLNLLAVDGPANQGKSDGDAATWLPSNKAFRCGYVARQVAVKTTYRLWVTAAEKDAIAGILAGCPGQTLPLPDQRVADDVAAHPSSAPSSTAPEPTAPAPQAPGEDPAPEPAPPAAAEPPAAGENGTATYANCSAVRAAGAAPLHAGSPGYSRQLDRDGDGVACE